MDLGFGHIPAPVIPIVLIAVGRVVFQALSRASARVNQKLDSRN
jgi:hypothetical protein